ncbi:MAG: LLM class flavin-dependent oxidoreductase [Dehalococcoidia bacterium]|nr:LLM class flavin-dependent oxidoreductase [Dehalococcoidia bacterium]
MTVPERMKFGIFLAPFHALGENPTLAIHRDLELIEWLDHLGYDEAWVGEHHSAGWELIASPEVFIAAAAERTKHINLGTGVSSLPYHHPLILADRIVLLDHLTRGRVMFGVGPGALSSDALMMGIEPATQRPRMEEALDAILQLFTQTDPLSMETDWFVLREARLQLRPYTPPHPKIAVAAVQSPAGMRLAGKHGAAVLTLALPRGERRDSALRDYWGVAEESAARHGRVMDRSEWRIVIHCHLAETREEAIAQTRVKAGEYQRGYFTETLSHDDPAADLSRDDILPELVGRGSWCVGTPDDLIAFIEMLQERSGGFGGLMVQAVEWADREAVRKSYELLARYVMPRFQGSLAGLEASQRAVAANSKAVRQLQIDAVERAKQAPAR